MTNLQRTTLAALAATALALVLGARAYAQQSARGEVLVVLASEAAGQIDPQLADIAALRQPPFSAFHTMQVLLRPEVTLTVGQPVQVPLPNGREVRLELMEITPQGRYRVRVSINRPDQHDYLPLLSVVASPGEPFFVAGQSFQGGTLVIGVRVGERAAR